MACASVAVISTRHVLSHRTRRHSDPELDEELMSDSLFAPADEMWSSTFRQLGRYEDLWGSR